MPFGLVIATSLDFYHLINQLVFQIQSAWSKFSHSSESLLSALPWKWQPENYPSVFFAQTVLSLSVGYYSKNSEERNILVSIQNA